MSFIKGIYKFSEFFSKILIIQFVSISFRFFYAQYLNPLVPIFKVLCIYSKNLDNYFRLIYCILKYQPALFNKLKKII